MKKSAVPLRKFSHADDTYEKGQTILNMDAGQFSDWEGVDLVREATAAEVAAAKKAVAAA